MENKEKPSIWARFKKFLGEKWTSLRARLARAKDKVVKDCVYIKNYATQAWSVSKANWNAGLHFRGIVCIPCALPNMMLLVVLTPFDWALEITYWVFTGAGELCDKIDWVDYPATTTPSVA